MKKIPTLFTREFANHKVSAIKNEITPGCEEAFLKGDATIKIDGSCCAIIDGEFYKRYDAKKGKKPPVGAIPCCEPDPITGHWPHWVKVDSSNPSDKWFCEAFNNAFSMALENGNLPLLNCTYEAIGPHFNGNPYNLKEDTLVPHGCDLVCVKRDFGYIEAWLETHNEEGLVFWLDNEPVCKIKRTDFGMSWPPKEDRR